MNPECTILVVDDEPNVLKSVRRLLFDSEYKILTAESGKIGLELFEKEPIQLVISDYRMPEMNGVEFLSKVKEKHPDTIRMILSGFADSIAILEAINDGQVYRFITKPWNDHEFRTTIIRALDQYKLQKENEKLYHELQEKNNDLMNLTWTLEEKVALRTRELEISNRAMMISHLILDLLPVGVIGIDKDEMLVYMNNSVGNYIKIDGVSPGLATRGLLPDQLIDFMMNALKENKEKCALLERESKTDVICTPLPSSEGVIALFSNKCTNLERDPIINNAQKGAAIDG